MQQTVSSGPPWSILHTIPRHPAHFGAQVWAVGSTGRPWEGLGQVLHASAAGAQVTTGPRPRPIVMGSVNPWWPSDGEDRHMTGPRGGRRGQHQEDLFYLFWKGQGHSTPTEDQNEATCPSPGICWYTHTEIDLEGGKKISSEDAHQVTAWEYPSVWLIRIQDFSLSLYLPRHFLSWIRSLILRCRLTWNGYAIFWEEGGKKQPIHQFCFRRS